jgi:catechol 2,3-dioxygenase-like lactoylglutathione lyase family enzyme
MSPRLEHVNLVVRDIDAALRFLRTALPSFEVRHDGHNRAGVRWVHVGTPECYIALMASTVEPAQPWTPYTGRPGVNHLAFEVDDVEALRRRMTAAGYRDTTVPNKHPARRRVYFSDTDGNDWEFVEYLTADPALRNDYALADY